jgi:putative FmdB family regulatory protein
LSSGNLYAVGLYIDIDRKHWMPIYEYQCRSCETDFEQFVRSLESDEPVACPHCKSKRVERKLSVFAAHQGGGSSSPPPSPCASCCDAGSCAMRAGF